MSEPGARIATVAESDALRAQMRGRIDPQSLIAAAIDKGAGVETLERLVMLANNIRQVTAREAWYDAMAQFQQRCPAIKKDSTAKIQTRSGGSYSYSYAALDTILAVVQPLLGELGLSVSWRQKHEAQAVSASCVVAHRLSHQEESGFITMPYGQDDGRMNPAQRVGSALTYARRYSLLAILGLAPEDDDDAHSTDGAARSREESRTPRGQAESPLKAAPTTSPAPFSSGQTTLDGRQPGEPLQDPDDPALVQESQALLPTPEEDVERQALIKRITAAGGKLPAKTRQHLKSVFLGDAEADVLTADVAALDALARHLEDSAKK